MGIQIIPNQPINLDPPIVDPCNVGDGKENCALYNVGDIMYMQFKQLPCGDDLVCDPTFQSASANLITNSQFHTDTDGWILSPEVTYDSGAENLRFAASSGIKSAYFTIYSLIPGKTYNVSFTTSGISAGTITPYLGGTAGAAVSTNTTTAVTMVCGAGNALLFYATGAFDGHLDDIAVSIVASCITNSGFTTGVNGYCHTPGTVSTLDIAVVLIDNTVYQKLTIEIEDMSAGFLYVYINGDLNGRIITESGTYNYYINSQTNFTITFSTDLLFDGCITGVSVYELRLNMSAAIVTMDNVLYEDVSGSLLYKDDFVYLAYDSFVLPEGCYKVIVYDPCNVVVGLSEISTDVGLDSPGTWTVVDDITGDCTTVVSGSKVTQTGVSGAVVVSMIARSCTWPAASLLLVEVTFETGTVDYVGNQINFLFPNAPGATSYTFSNVVSNSIYSRQFMIALNNANPSNAYGSNIYNKFGIGLYGGTGGGSSAGLKIEIKSFSVKVAAAITDEYPYISNCISVRTAHDCSKLIEGYMDADKKALGFYFVNGSDFRLSSRYRFLKFNPHYPIDEDNYKYSNGERKLTYGEREKYYEGKIDYIDETGHDALSASFLCDDFTVAGVQYYVKGEDYKPEWDKEGGRQLAQARIAMRKTGGTIYNKK